MFTDSPARKPDPDTLVAVPTGPLPGERVVAGAVIVKFFDANAGVAAESCAPTAYVPGLTDVGKVTLRLLNAPVLSVVAVASAVPEQGAALQAQ
jgi:hypothetical protein